MEKKPTMKSYASIDWAMKLSVFSVNYDVNIKIVEKPKQLNQNNKNPTRNRKQNHLSVLECRTKLREQKKRANKTNLKLY